MRLAVLCLVLLTAACAGATGPAQGGPQDATGTTSSPASAAAVNPQTGANNGASAR